MKAGTKVEVRSQFDHAWASGFVVEETIGEGEAVVAYRVRRLSDGMVLPREFPREEVRRERKGGMWWAG
ncbi:MAG: hypothetical protein IT198_12025 [Acidimicrobiia bacterium]|nr:hypothetical protein [Acidimicrobiia bacterium]